MPPGALPDDVQLLLQDEIRSIEHLEILLAVFRNPDRSWTPAEVYQQIRSNERSVEKALQELSKRGLLNRIEGPPVSYRFAPRSPALAETVARLSDLYAERRVRIVEAIYSERVSEVDEFARAFRLRKDSNG